MSALEVRDLHKSYGETVAIEGLGFGVAPGELFGFVGPNGAGKTTTMRIILGVLAADRGEVLWRGEPITESTRRQIGYMPEERGLYPKMKVGEQLAYMAMLHGQTAAAAQVSAARWIERLGLVGRAGDPVEELSLGNQQRVQLAAALGHEPELLVLDEPFSGLDPVGVDALSGTLREEADRRQVPVIFSSHQLDLVERLCDSVAIVAAGKLVAAGTVAELKAEDGANRWVAEVDGAAIGWEERVPGARRISRRPSSSSRVPIPSGFSTQPVPPAACAGLGPDSLTLADLFRERVERAR